MAFPDFPPRHTIVVYCSVIHVESALVLLLAQHELANTGCMLDIAFYNTSSDALRGFQKSTWRNEPALITVTEGTKNRLEDFTNAGKGGYYRLLEVPPGILRWTSPESRPVTALRDLFGQTFIYTNHPTDVLAVEEFQRVLVAQTESMTDRLQFTIRPPIDVVPECRDVYQGRSFYLTNSFMDRWALLGNEPSAVILDWIKEERRFLFVNQPLCDLCDGKGRSIVRFLQQYLAWLYQDLSDVKRRFVNNLTHVGGGKYIKAGSRYLGVKV